MADGESLLDNVVVFELPAAGVAEAFQSRFGQRWSGWTHSDGEMWLFTASLEPGLAVLLREAKELIGELGLHHIRFLVDDTIYVLDAPPGSTASAA